MWRLWTRQSEAIYLLNRRKHDRNVLSPTHNPHTHASYSVAGEVVVMVARGGGVNWRDFVARTGLWHPHFGGVCRYLASVWERRTIYMWEWSPSLYALTVVGFICILRCQICICIFVLYVYTYTYIIADNLCKYVSFVHHPKTPLIDLNDIGGSRCVRNSTSYA